jgi:tetratricopeptide (TPR) repeat protein/serine phosphatase RsbU (regulator of sigma subunit)
MRYFSLGSVSIILITILFCSPTFGQNQKKIDSLFSVIDDFYGSEGYVKDTLIIDVYLELGKQFSKDNGTLDSSIYYFDKAIGLSDEVVAKWKTKIDKEKKLYLQIFKAAGFSSKGRLFYKERMFEVSDSLGIIAIDLLKPLEFENNKSIKNKALKTYTGTLIWFGVSHHVRGKYDEALLYYEEAARLARITKDAKNESQAIGTAAVIFKNQGKFKKALDYNFKALDLAKQSKDLNRIAGVYSNIGILYKNMGDYELAIDYYKKTIKLYEQTGSTSDIGRMFNNMGVALRNQEKYEEALDYYKDALKIGRELKNEGNIMSANTNVANVLNDLKRFKDAQEYLLEAVEIGERNKLKRLLITAYSSLGTTYSRLGEVEKCLPLYEKMLQFAEEMDSDKFRMSAYHKFFEYYEQVKDFEKSLKYYRKFIDIKEKLNNDEIKRATIKKETEYNYRVKKVADSIAFAEKNKVNELLVKQKEKELHSQKNQQITLAVVASLILIFAFIMFNRFKVTKKQNKIIEKQKEIVEVKNKEISDSINYAKRIQEAILPSIHTFTDSLKDGFVLFQPKDVVSGDFYWVETYKNKTYLAVADCTGHGVPGAMISVICSNALSKVLLEEGYTEPGEILDHTRDIIIEKLRKSGEAVNDGMDISLCAIDTINKEIKWSGANNPLWIFSKTYNDLELKEFKPDKQPIGIYESTKSFTTHSITINQSDTIYLFSDGFVDQFGGNKGKKYKVGQFRELLLSIQHSPIENHKELIEQELKSWMGDYEQVDDICIVGVRI